VRGPQQVSASTEHAGVLVQPTRAQSQTIHSYIEPFSKGRSMKD
jgi:hypothetical protein